MRIYPVTDEASWAAVKAIRQRVFVEEQACPPEEEWDAYDWPADRGHTCRHLLGEEGGGAIAVARWRPVQWGGGPAAKLERFAVLPEHRGGGHGRAMIAATIADAQAAGYDRFVLHAQAHLEPLYAGFGFRRGGGVFDEAGIPHVKMVRQPPLAGEPGATG